jgi:hypothetical protein
LDDISTSFRHLGRSAVSEAGIASVCTDTYFQQNKKRNEKRKTNITNKMYTLTRASSHAIMKPLNPPPPPPPNSLAPKIQLAHPPTTETRKHKLRISQKPKPRNSKQRIVMREIDRSKKRKRRRSHAVDTAG